MLLETIYTLAYILLSVKYFNICCTLLMTNVLNETLENYLREKKYLPTASPMEMLMRSQVPVTSLESLQIPGIIINRPFNNNLLKIFCG